MWPPPAARWGRNARQPWTTPQKLTPITHSHELIGPNHGSARAATPALLHTTWTAPKWSIVCCGEGLHLGLLADVGLHRQRLDAVGLPAARWRPRGRRPARRPSTTFSRPPAKRSASANPIPLAAAGDDRDLPLGELHRHPPRDPSAGPGAARPTDRSWCAASRARRVRRRCRRAPAAARDSSRPPGAECRRTTGRTRSSWTRPSSAITHSMSWGPSKAAATLSATTASRARRWVPGPTGSPPDRTSRHPAGVIELGDPLAVDGRRIARDDQRARPPPAAGVVGEQDAAPRRRRRAGCTSTGVVGSCGRGRAAIAARAPSASSTTVDGSMAPRARPAPVGAGRRRAHDQWPGAVVGGDAPHLDGGRACRRTTSRSSARRRARPGGLRRGRRRGWRPCDRPAPRRAPLGVSSAMTGAVVFMGAIGHDRPCGPLEAGVGRSTWKVTGTAHGGGFARQ